MDIPPGASPASSPTHEQASSWESRFVPNRATAHEKTASAKPGAHPPVVVRPIRHAGPRVSITNHTAAESRPDNGTLELTDGERAYLQSALSVLTPRERDVVYEICSGGTNEIIADRLCVALPTLRTHLMRLNQKLGTSSKGDVVRFVACRLLWGYRASEITARPAAS